MALTLEKTRKQYSLIKSHENVLDLGMTCNQNMTLITLNKNELIGQLIFWIQSQLTENVRFQCLESDLLCVQAFDGTIGYMTSVTLTLPNGEVTPPPFCPMSAWIYGTDMRGFVFVFREKKWRNLMWITLDNFQGIINNITQENIMDTEYMTAYFNYHIDKTMEIIEELENKRIQKTQSSLLEDLEAEKNKKSSSKKKKKVKEAKVQVNPHKKEIRVSEGIWKPNPAWKKWEQENKRSASPP